MILNHLVGEEGGTYFFENLMSTNGLFYLRNDVYKGSAKFFFKGLYINYFWLCTIHVVSVEHLPIFFNITILDFPGGPAVKNLP